MDKLEQKINNKSMDINQTQLAINHLKNQITLTLDNSPSTVEFKHILSTFPIVEERIKEKTLNAFLADNYSHIC